MIHTLQVLIVENDDTDIEIYNDTIKTFNTDYENEFRIEAKFEKTKEGGLSALNESDWMAAFVDLKLSTGDILNAEEGNEIIREIYKKKRFPIYVLTNTPSGVSSEFQESAFLKISSKDDVNYANCFVEIINIFKTGILNILGKRGSIEKYIDDIFWNNLSNSLEEWFEIENCEKHLLRYTLSHFQQYLEISEEGNFEDYHPMEAYIYPSINKPHFTGDIILYNEKKQIILTPACDLAPHGIDNKPKTDRVLLAEIEPHSMNILSKCVKKIQRLKNNGTPDQQEEDKLLRLIKNNYADQYFYLPESKLFEGGIVNFRKLISVKIKELTGCDTICNLNTPFVKDLIAKFSFYYARQGAPDFSFNKLFEKHIS